MRYIHYAGQDLLTSDAAAAAVSAYSTELANHEQADEVDVPFIQNGRNSIARLIIGPASQLVITDADTAELPMHGDDLLEQIRDRTEKLRNRRNLLPAESFSDFDFD